MASTEPPLTSNAIAHRLLDKIQRHEAHVATVGLGYVGLPLSVEFAQGGLSVTGFDLTAEKVDAVNRGESYIRDVPGDVIERLVRERRLRASDDFDELAGCDAVVICVPTPLGKTKDPDLSMVVGATQAIAKRLREGQLVVLESTTYPGTTEELLLPILTEGGLVAGESFFLAFSPERVDPGNPRFKTRNTPKIIGGLTPTCTRVAQALYAHAVDHVIPVSSTRAAEMVKLLENTFRSVNIGLVNEVALMCDRLGVDVWEVIDAAASKPFGFMPFYPGPGLGGHCIEGGETVCIRDQTGVHVLPFRDLFDSARAQLRTVVGGVDVAVPVGLEALSIDTLTGEACFSRVSHLFRRDSSTPLLRLRLMGDRTVTVTDGHPMLTYDGTAIGVQPASELKRGDLVVMTKAWQHEKDGAKAEGVVDQGTFATVSVDGVEPNAAAPVYSMEVEGTGTFVTSYGVAVHNCIPIDPLYLSWKLKTLNYRARFIELAGEINSAMPEYVCDRVAWALNERERSVKGSRVLVLGVTYKRDVDDVRESPALDILKILESRGATVAYNDPYVPELQLNGNTLRSEELMAAVRHANVTVIVTDHTCYPYREIVDQAQVVVDTRNATKGIASAKVLKI